MLSVIRDQREQNQSCAKHQRLQTGPLTRLEFLELTPPSPLLRIHQLQGIFSDEPQPIITFIFSINSYGIPSLCQARKLQTQPLPHRAYYGPVRGGDGLQQ